MKEKAYNYMYLVHMAIVCMIHCMIEPLACVMIIASVIVQSLQIDQ